MPRTWRWNWLAVVAFLAISQFSVDSVQSAERRVRPLRSLLNGQASQPVNNSPAYGPVQRSGGLPVGRTYYGGRYFGNFNNRFYGPQYGYF